MIWLLFLLLIARIAVLLYLCIVRLLCHSVSLVMSFPEFAASTHSWCRYWSSANYAGSPWACGSVCPGRCFTCLPESDWCLQTEYTAGPVSLFPDACRVRRTKNRSGQIINEAPVPAGDAVIFQIQKWTGCLEKQGRAFKGSEKALLSKLNKELRKGADESETLRQLEVLQKNSAEEPVRYKFIFNDATTAAIKNQLCGKWRSVGIMSDEAGIIFDGYTLSELPFINKMWDGSVLSVDRKNEPEQMIENARMTLSLMVQPGLLTDIWSEKVLLPGTVVFLPVVLSVNLQPRRGNALLTELWFREDH